MIETIQFKDKVYPAFQAAGFAAQFAFPFALQVCKGVGYDIGCNRHAWCLPGAIPIDPLINPEYDAMNLPEGEVDFIASSHMVEHFVGNIANMLDYWASKIKSEGVLFLYLPDYSQHYWRFWNNRKHIHTLTPVIMSDLLHDLGHFKKIFVSNADLNNSFICMCEKI